MIIKSRDNRETKEEVGKGMRRRQKTESTIFQGRRTRMIGLCLGGVLEEGAKPATCMIMQLEELERADHIQTHVQAISSRICACLR